tara:strand:- start:3017 stop:3583 length:567 start_codon:yes stop_codon:yes gene_type:complete
MKTKIELLQAKYDEALRGQLMVRDAISSESDSPEHSVQIVTEMRKRIHDMTDASKSDGRLICLKCGELETAYARITELEKKSAPILSKNHEQHNALTLKDAAIKALRTEIEVWKVDLEAAYGVVAELEKTNNAINKDRQMQANAIITYNALQRRVHDLRCAIDGFIAAAKPHSVYRRMFEHMKDELRT